MHLSTNRLSIHRLPSLLALALPLALTAACSENASDRGGNGDKADSATALGPAEARARIDVASRAVQNSLRTVERSGDKLSHAASQTPVSSLLGDGAELPSDSSVDDFLRGMLAEDLYEGQGTYLLGSELFCESDDTECAAQYRAAEIRIFVGASGDELIVKPMVGPQRVAPLVFAASERGGRLAASLEFDLGATKSAIEHLGQVFDFPVSLPQTMSGVGFIEAERVESEGTSRLIAGLMRDVRIEGADYRVTLAQAPSVFGSAVDSVEEALVIAVPDDVNDDTEVHMHLGELELILPWSALGQEEEVSGGLLVQWEGMVLDMLGTADAPTQFRVLAGDSRVFVEADETQSETRITYETPEVVGTYDGQGVTHADYPNTIGDLVTYDSGSAATSNTDGSISGHNIAAGTQVYSLIMTEQEQAELDGALAQQTGDATATGASIDCVIRGSYTVTENGDDATAQAGQCILGIKGDAIGTAYVVFVPQAQ